MSGIALDKCSLLSVFVESVLWGIFLSLYFITVYLLIQKRSNIVKHAPHLLLLTIMFVLCTMHVGLSFRRALDAFFLAPAPIPYLEDVTVQSSRIKRGVQVVQILLSDLLIVSRSFLLWDKNYLVAALPCVLVGGTLVAGVGTLLALSTASSAAALEAHAQPWMISLLVLTLATKAVCLLLVGFRVQQIHASITSHVNRHLSVYTLIVVLVESGAAALFACIVLLPMFVTKRNAHHIVWDALSPIMGITFTTIIAGMTVNLTKPTPTVSIPRPTWNRQTLPRPPKGWWNEAQDVDTPPSSPVMSRPASIQNQNKSSGTLNMAIVI